MSQDDLNCSLIGVCDLFDVNANLGIDASENEDWSWWKTKISAKKYKNHREMLENTMTSMQL